MTGNIAIDADVLLAHARKVAGFADDVDTALSAVNSVNLGGGAFGLLCAWMAPPAHAVSNVITSHTRESRQVLERTQRQLRNTVEDYSELEESHKAVLRALGGGLE
ncbi:type VII secretion target [Microbacterium horticulturae]|uniref:Type VII secretion target n=1 Tax=Microbacterium horticulturae TaxID=3028316 RepID=A0ABY8BWT2_9MICO|nr:type VII secretion target [Microbacterium sp. KACC 23027]WEG08614.1 type VII secretion target [Microbacterium sp. KACC 23027]